MAYESYRDYLLGLAEESIYFGRVHGKPPVIELSGLPEGLTENGASFVTLKTNGELRGCIGSIEAYRPLVDDIVHNAFSAAFKDPRFNPLEENECGTLEINISILSKPESISFSSETDLLKQIRPNVDGLIIEASGSRGTFLPSVWDSLPDTTSFLAQLKIKAGLSPDFWSDNVRVWRYTAEHLK